MYPVCSVKQMDKLSSLFFEDTEDDDIQFTVPDVTQGACASSEFADDYYASGQLVSDGSASFPEEDSNLALGWVGFADVDLATAVKRKRNLICM